MDGDGRGLEVEDGSLSEQEGKEAVAGAVVAVPVLVALAVVGVGGKGGGVGFGVVQEVLGVAALLDDVELVRTAQFLGASIGWEAWNGGTGKHIFF